MSDRIEETRDRLNIAEKIEADLTGKRRDGLTLQAIGSYTVVDDGQDRWIQTSEEFGESAELVIGEALDGHFDSNADDQPEILANAYERLCHHCPAIYSRIGSPSDVESLVDDLECDTPTMLEIFDALGIDDEPLPAMIRVVHRAGDRFAGNHASDMALEWIADEFDADAAEQWIDAGFWDPPTAGACKRAGMNPSDAEDAATWLIERDGAEAYTDGSPIYAACNNDIATKKLIDAYTAITADTD